MIDIDNNFNDTQTPLPPLLTEFRTALLDEIEAAKRNSRNSAIPLSNGHLIGQQGNAYQYAFLMDSVLDTPDGTPGDLIVTGKEPFGVTIVSVEGLRIIISIETNLGQFIPNARIQTNLTILMRKLICRIEDNALRDNPAALRMLGDCPVSGTPSKPETAPNLNPKQMSALESALGRNLTIIWGPPGTGKTHTIGTITKYLYDLGRTVLIVSHTNTAIDQAIKKIAESMPKNLEQGNVIRIGIVKDESLKKDFPDVLIEQQIQRHSRELVEKRDNLETQKQTYNNELNDIQKHISIIEWIKITSNIIDSIKVRINELHEQEIKLRTDRNSLNELEKTLPNIKLQYDYAAKLLLLRNNIATYNEKLAHLNEILLKNKMLIENKNSQLNKQEKRIEDAKRISQLRQELSGYPTTDEQRTVIGILSSNIADIETRLESSHHDYITAKALLDQTCNAGAIKRILKRLPKPEEQQAIVNNLSNLLTSLNTELIATQAAHKAASNKLARILELNTELTLFNDIGSEQDELTIKQNLLRSINILTAERNKYDSEYIDTEIITNQMALEENKLTSSINGDAKDVYQKAISQLQLPEQLRNSIKSINLHVSKNQNSILTDLNNLFKQLEMWGEISFIPTALDEMMDLICEKYKSLSNQYQVFNITVLQEQAKELQIMIRDLSGEIASIEERLSKIEREVIMQAAVIGATLTKTYLSDDLHNRKFDTVILDEASMAPIPALWVAALLSENNLIIVGDFKQLSPIVLSNSELAEKWLGRDIFEASGIKAKYQNNSASDYFIQLNEQRRMLPEIANIVNLFYNNELCTKDLPNKSEDFNKWYNTNWAHDNPVVLIDTGNLHAWVTSVVKNGNPSRVNFLSAALSIDLAEQLLSPDRPHRCEGESKRILIISPYRAHSKLVNLLLRSNNSQNNEPTDKFQSGEVESEVESGTVHSFQGSEADVVIFDLVADEPQFRVNLFIPSYEEQICRLLNVGLSRARYRLFIIGDLAYCRQHAKKLFLGRTLIPFLLESFPRIDAAAIFPDSLAAKAAQAQIAMLGGEIEPTADRIVVTQADFYRILSSDFSRAQNRIIIYSPFLTKDRLSFLLPQLQAAVLRGVTIFVITKTHSERLKGDISYIRNIEKQLSSIGVVVMHKMRMHEKLVFIDNDIIWSGSLNPLSYSNTQEVMERRKSKAVLDDYFQILRLHELLAIHNKPESQCPICHSEIVAAEGRVQPYYWRCIIDECYTRSIDQPYPFDGMLTCGADDCNSPVEFGYWGDYPHWRCTKNNRHRQKIYKSHLRLPKMADLIPKCERKKVCKFLGIDDLKNHVYNPKQSNSVITQHMLFDDMD